MASRRLNMTINIFHRYKYDTILFRFIYWGEKYIALQIITMTSLDRRGIWNHQPHCLLYNVFRQTLKKIFKLCITGPLCGEFVGDLHFDSTLKGSLVQRATCHDVLWIKLYVKPNFRRHRAHNDVIVMNNRKNNGGYPMTFAVGGGDLRFECTCRALQFPEKLWSSIKVLFYPYRKNHGGYKTSLPPSNL